MEVRGLLWEILLLQRCRLLLSISGDLPPYPPATLSGSYLHSTLFRREHMQVLQPLQLMPQLMCCCRQLSPSVQISAWWQLRPNTRFLLQLLLLGQWLQEEHRSREGKVLSCYRKMRQRDINRALNEISYIASSVILPVHKHCSYQQFLQTSSHQAAVKSLNITGKSLQHSGSIRQSSRATHLTSLSIFKIPERKEKAYLMTHRHVLSILKCHVLNLSAVLCQLHCSLAALCQQGTM